MRILSLLLALLPIAAQAQPTQVIGDLPRKASGPLEFTQGLETRYEQVRMADGRRLRVFLTRRSGAARPLPAIFQTQAVSCGSQEWAAEGRRVSRAIALRSGRVLIRVERSGTGDSEGPGCDKLDYDTEVADYRAALAALKRHPWIDPKRIVVWGSSLGSTTAPLVADGSGVEGVFVQGAGGVTYLERMIGFDRLNLDRSGRWPAEKRHPEMLRRIRFQTHYLLEKKTPAQVVAEHPDLAGVWEGLFGTDAAPHYGRPYAWHWQAAEKDFLGAWSRIAAPVLVLFAEYEGFEMAHGHATVVETVNALRPGAATFVSLPRTGHDLLRYPDPFKAYGFEGGELDVEAFAGPVLAWLERLGAP
jgi:hypothetical protein